MKTVSFFIFRHGETDWNVQKRFQGHTDRPLNENGRRQALELKPVLLAQRPQFLLCSDLIRAQETAQLIQPSPPLPIVLSSGLRECNLGQAEGLHRDEVLRVFGESSLTTWRDVSQDTLHFGFPGGLTKRQHLELLRSTLLTAVQQQPSVHRFAVSTHGGSLIRLIHDSVGAPQEAIQIYNCCLYHLDLDTVSQKFFFRGRLHPELRPTSNPS